MSRSIIRVLTLTALLGGSIPGFVQAYEVDTWEKLSVSLGAFVSNTQSGVRVGSGLGLDLNLEDALGLDSQTAVFRSEAAWRFSSNHKHRLDASWFALRRSANRKVGQDFDIQDSDGNTVTIQAGSDVASHFDLDIYELAYSYSFLQDDRVDLAVVGGVYVMPINFGLNSTGLTNASGSFNFTAPLPVVGGRVDIALTPKWYLRSGAQFFYAKYQNFSGNLTQLRSALEFVPVQHVAVGVGVDTLNIGMEAKDEDYPAVDFKGNVDFRYTGIQLYGKLRF